MRKSTIKRKVLYGTQNKIRIKGMVHYGENDQKVNYDADGDLTGSGDPALRTAQCEHFTEQYDDTGQKFRGGTGRNQCQCSE
jgi:hypothetical protein